MFQYRYIIVGELVYIILGLMNHPGVKFGNLSDKHEGYGRI